MSLPSSHKNHKESTVVIYAIIGSFLVTVGGKGETKKKKKRENGGRAGGGGEREKKNEQWS